MAANPTGVTGHAFELSVDVQPFVAALQRVDRVVVDECQHLVARAAAMAEARLIPKYPIGPTGRLRGSITVQQGTVRGGFSSGPVQPYTVRNRAPHAHLYERGTAERRNYSRRGAKRGWMFKRQYGYGAGTGRPVFSATMSQVRREMWAQVGEVLRRAGAVFAGSGV